MKREKRKEKSEKGKVKNPCVIISCIYSSPFISCFYSSLFISCFYYSPFICIYGFIFRFLAVFIEDISKAKSSLLSFAILSNSISLIKSVSCSKLSQ